MMRDGGPAGEDVKPLRITDRRMLVWFYRELRPYWVRVAIGTSATLIATASQLVWPRTLKSIIDKVISGHEYELLPRYLLIIALAYFGQQLFSAVRMNVMHILGQRFVYNLRRECYEHLSKLSLSFFDDHPTGDIMSRLSNDVTAVEDMVVHGVDEVISNVFLALGVLAILFYNFSGRLEVVAAGL